MEKWQKQVDADQDFEIPAYGRFQMEVLGKFTHLIGQIHHIKDIQDDNKCLYESGGGTDRKVFDLDRALLSLLSAAAFHMYLMYFQGDPDMELAYRQLTHNYRESSRKQGEEEVGKLNTLWNVK